MAAGPAIRIRFHCLVVCVELMLEQAKGGDAAAVSPKKIGIMPLTNPRGGNLIMEHRDKAGGGISAHWPDFGTNVVPILRRLRNVRKHSKS